MEPKQKLNLIRIPMIFFGIVLLLFTYYAYKLYSGGEYHRYHLKEKIIEIYLIIGIPFLILVFLFLWKRKKYINEV